jgi:hypothetical protein
VLVVHAGVEFEVLLDGEPLKGVEVLRKDSHPPLHLRALGFDGDVMSENPDGARRGVSQRLEDLDGRGLPRAVRAQEGEDLSLEDFEGDAVYSLQAAVSLH